MNLASEKKELNAHLVNKHISNNTHANLVEITNHAISESLHCQCLDFCQDKNIKCSGLFFKILLKKKKKPAIIFQQVPGENKPSKDILLLIWVLCLKFYSV